VSATRSNEEIVREVFRRVADADDTVADLYDEDAVIVPAVGDDKVGRNAIRDHYLRTYSVHAPKPEVVELFQDGDRVMVVVEITTGDGSKRRAADLFEMSGSGIRRMSIFSGNAVT
jgi:ketosteroid isomerase-like protein